MQKEERFIPPFLSDSKSRTVSRDCTLELYNSIADEYEDAPKDIKRINKLISVLQGFVFQELEKYSFFSYEVVNEKKRVASKQIINAITPIKDYQFAKTTYYGVMAQNWLVVGDLDKAAIFYKALLEIPGFAEEENILQYENILKIVKNLMLIYHLQNKEDKREKVREKYDFYFRIVRNFYEDLILDNPQADFDNLKQLCDPLSRDVIYLDLRCANTDAIQLRENTRVNASFRARSLDEEFGNLYYNDTFRIIKIGERGFTIAKINSGYDDGIVYVYSPQMISQPSFQKEKSFLQSHDLWAFFKVFEGEK